MLHSILRRMATKFSRHAGASRQAPIGRRSRLLQLEILEDTDSRIEFNSAAGGAPGIGMGDTVGQGIGGGVYNDLGTFSDVLLTILAHNLATTSNNNIFP